MTGPYSFENTTQKFSLPLLFAGQAQKEFFVNQAFSLIDAALAKVIVATLSTPPSSANEGDVYRISAGMGEWAGKDDMLAAYIAGAWHFFLPTIGSLIFDQSANIFSVFDGSWAASTVISEPQGGTVIDVEARAAIAQLIQCLQALRLTP